MSNKYASWIIFKEFLNGPPPASFLLKVIEASLRILFKWASFSLFLSFQLSI